MGLFINFYFRVFIYESIFSYYYYDFFSQTSNKMYFIALYEANNDPQSITLIIILKFTPKLVPCWPLFASATETFWFWGVANNNRANLCHSRKFSLFGRITLVLFERTSQLISVAASRWPREPKLSCQVGQPLSWFCVNEAGCVRDFGERCCLKVDSLFSSAFK